MAVYGDALAASGAALGMLVQLQLALEARPEEPRLVAAEARHLATFGRELLGAASTHTSLFQLEWRRGFVVRAAVRSLAQETVDGFRPEVRHSRLAKATRELFRAPVCVELTQPGLEMPWSAIVVAHFSSPCARCVTARPHAHAAGGADAPAEGRRVGRSHRSMGRGTAGRWGVHHASKRPAARRVCRCGGGLAARAPPLTFAERARLSLGENGWGVDAPVSCARRWAIVLRGACDAIALAPPVLTRRCVEQGMEAVGVELDQSLARWAGMGAGSPRHLLAAAAWGGPRCRTRRADCDGRGTMGSSAPSLPTRG
jgi:hypothetical protein